MEEPGLITNPANALPTFEIHNLLFEPPLPSENDDRVGEGSEQEMTGLGSFCGPPPPCYEYFEDIVVVKFCSRTTARF